MDICERAAEITSRCLTVSRAMRKSTSNAPAWACQVAELAAELALLEAALIRDVGASYDVQDGAYL